jgi:hypothetical protein
MDNSPPLKLQNEFYHEAAYSIDYGEEACWTFIESKEEAQECFRRFLRVV